jgi:ADP-heptose:LPS heptosyltransferase
VAKRPQKRIAVKVLIVRFSAIGDCVMAGHAVNDLRHQYPDAEITWVVEDRCAEVIASPKLVHRRLDLPRREWRTKGDFRTLFAQYRWLTGLRKYAFDYGFDLQGHSKTAWCLRLSGASKRLSIGGTDVLAKKLNPIFVDSGLEQIHSVERSRKMVGSLLTINPVRSDFLPGEPVERNRRLVTIGVGAGHPSKVIPPAVLSAVGTQIASNSFDVVYLGSKDDSFEAPSGTTSLVGKTSIQESIDLVRKSAVHIAGDTGTGHIAAVVGTPLVTIWGNMPIDRFRPFTENVTILNRGGVPANVPVPDIVEAVLGRIG